MFVKYLSGVFLLFILAHSITDQVRKRNQCSNLSMKMGKIIHLNKDLKPQAVTDKTPQTFQSAISKFIKGSEKNFPQDRQHVKEKTPSWGTNDNVIANSDMGFFSSIYECYNNHWALITVPDDWWYTIIRTIALAIDDNAKNEKVRNFFVNHEGKKELIVEVDPNNIDFEKFYREMTNQIQENIKLDGYVDAVRSDFSTSTSTHRIVSEITVMSSMQEYFEYVMAMACGIPYIEFLGTEEDWRHLKIKLLGKMQEIVLYPQ